MTYPDKPIITATIIADSMAPNGTRLTTMELVYPRFIHAELLTHRVFSRNSSSSRAIPTTRLLNNILNNAACPIHWGKNKKGMQAAEELSPKDKDRMRKLWFDLMTTVVHEVEKALEEMDSAPHKQIINRLLEPWMYMRTLVSATDWDNFFELRIHHDAQPEIQELAKCMKEAMESSKPFMVNDDDKSYWHLPYVDYEDRQEAERIVDRNGVSYASHEAREKDINSLLCRISSARCARVSYKTLDTNKRPTVEQDLALFGKLVGSKPEHASPLEHVATPGISNRKSKYSGNFRGWLQFRHLHHLMPVNFQI